LKIYLDSAIEIEARKVREWGWVYGVTTNPVLMSQSKSSVDVTLANLSSLGFNEVFYQLVSKDYEGMVSEAKKAANIVGNPLVLKVPPSELGFRFVASHCDEFNCCVTAIYDPAQALVARASGAKYLAVYVNRATRLLGDGYGLVKKIAQVLDGGSTELIAASIKSTDEATNSLVAGARHLTLSMSVLELLASNSLSIDTMKQFDRDGKGLDIYML
jgi:transaldolase